MSERIAKAMLALLEHFEWSQHKMITMDVEVVQRPACPVCWAIQSDEPWHRDHEYNCPLDALKRALKREIE